MNWCLCQAVFMRSSIIVFKYLLLSLIEYANIVLKENVVWKACPKNVLVNAIDNLLWGKSLIKYGFPNNMYNVSVTSRVLIFKNFKF